MAKVTSKIASLPSQRQQMETRFVELMSELFSLDEAEALDFGLYRVIRRHNREVKAFLGEIISENESKALQGGRLAELLPPSRPLVTRLRPRTNSASKTWRISSGSNPA